MECFRYLRVTDERSHSLRNLVGAAHAAIDADIAYISSDYDIHHLKQ